MPTLHATSRIALKSVTYLAIAFSFVYVALLVSGNRPLAMSSGSMTPTIGVGDLVIGKTVDAANLHTGQMITFRKPVGTALITTHRIVKVVRTSDGQIGYRTRGDAATITDPWTLVYEKGQKAQTVRFTLPYLGYPLLYMQLPAVRLVLIAFAVFSLFFALIRKGSTAVAGKQEERLA